MTERRPIALIVQTPPGQDRDGFINLEGEDFVVWHASSGAEARKLLAAAREAELMPDVIVVERDLPDVDGLVLCAFVQQVVQCPIVLCAHVSGVVDRTLAYRIGVDGFVGFPAIEDELHALITGLLRVPGPNVRNEPAPAGDDIFVSFGNLKIDEEQRSVRVGDHRVRLSPTEYRLLVALARSAPTVVPTAELCQVVWNGSSEVPLPPISSCVARLRSRLSALPGQAPAILTVPRVGYRLELS